jgi:polysaccharide biosynthesis protein PslH
MRVLFLSWWWPYPADNGSKIRIYNLLRNLAAAHEVTLLSFAENDDATPEGIQHLQSFCAHVEAVPKPAFQPGSAKALLGYFSPWPRSLVDVYSPQMAGRVAEMVNAGKVDVVVASQLQTMRYLELARGLPIVLEEAEITVFQDAVHKARGRERLRAQLTLTKLENALRGLMKRGAALTVVSDAEQDFMRRIAPADARIVVVPNGVDTQANRPDETPPQPYSLIYNGAVTYNANYDAVKYFACEVLPLIRQKFPQATFTITGGTGKVDVEDLKAQPGVVFSGYLPSVAPAVRASWASVVPLRIGGGTRLKVLEAMALGTPVISTRKGAEGLNIQPGENILIADTPEALAQAVDRLFQDTQLRAALARGGRALVEREYDWAVIARRLNDLLQEIISSKHSV